MSTLRPQTVARWLARAGLRRDPFDSVQGRGDGTVEVRLGCLCLAGGTVPLEHRARVWAVLAMLGGYRRCSVLHLGHQTRSDAVGRRWWDVLMVSHIDVISPAMVNAVARALALGDGVPSIFWPHQVKDEVRARYMRQAWAALTAERALLEKSLAARTGHGVMS